MLSKVKNYLRLGPTVSLILLCGAVVVTPPAAFGFNSGDWSAKRIYAECIRGILRASGIVPNVPNGLTDEEVNTVWKRLVTDSDTRYRAIPFYRGKDASNRIVSRDGREIALGLIIEPGLLLCFKELPRAADYWSTLARFSKWNLSRYESGKPWHGERYIPHNTSYHIELFPERGGEVLIKLNMWSSTEGRDDIEHLYDKIRLAEAETRKIKQDFRFNISSRSYGGTRGWMRAINEENMFFLTTLIGFETLSSEESLRRVRKLD